jgi:hypothetical protein
MNIEQHNIDEELRKLRQVAWKMDALFYIPRTNISVGLDNIIGLVPVVGDIIALAPSVWMIHRAHKLGATPGALAYMIANTTADLVIGSVPIIGDLFDMLYNANIRNYRALERNLEKKAAMAREVRMDERMLEMT